ncbi:ATP-dependent OLD family endonuclease [Opitutaceae bacterium TAV5]|nr:ATP-dependent OLD family endonuclease [Opitutaceae bacterium TAV5]
MSASATPSKPTTLKRLTIERFRGIKSLTWDPVPGVNFVLGGGDAGKTTILEAIALLLSPNASYSISDTDYWERDVEKEFLIEGILSLSDGIPVSHQKQMNWPWHWDGKDIVPAAVEGATGGEPVYRFRVRGTADLELAYEVVQPDNETNSLPATLRRAIGLVRLSGEDRNDRDLRLVQGSALDRMLDDKGFRARAARELADDPVDELLAENAKKALGQLNTAFKGNALPEPLGLGITGGAGMSLNALIGLTAPKGSTSLPLVSWGAGTRRLASLTIAGALHDRSPITLVDELERGLECYRQRKLVRALKDATSQVFVTTHSAAALEAAEGCAFWYLDAGGNIGPLAGAALQRQLLKDPEAFLSRFTVVAEGATEVGFVAALLKRTIDVPLADHGIHITDAGSNEGALDLLQALGKAGLAFGGMADNEGLHSGRWAETKKNLGDKLCRWEKGCLEEEIIACLDDTQIEAFIRDSEDQLTGVRLRTLADRLGLEDKSFAVISAKAGVDLRRVMVEACCGTVPDDKKGAEKSVKRSYQAHAQSWFKSRRGGYELADKVMVMKLWPQLKPVILPFLNAIRTSSGLSAIEDLTA